MKRSERFLMMARREALWASLILSATVAGCVWSVAAMLPSLAGGPLAAAIAAAGLCAAGMHLRECMFCLRQSAKEEQWERRREIRPRV